MKKTVKTVALFLAVLFIISALALAVQAADGDELTPPDVISETEEETSEETETVAPENEEDEDLPPAAPGVEVEVQSAEETADADTTVPVETSEEVIEEEQIENEEEIEVLDVPEEFYLATPPADSEFVACSGLKLTRFIVGKTWTNLPYNKDVDHMEGVQFQTTSSYFYFQYRVKVPNVGWSDWYYSTNGSTYPGSSGKPVSNIQVKVYNNITKSYDYTDYVIMYRTKVAGEWLDWVSNGEPEIMQTIKKDFSLDGNLDTSATDSGWASRGNITQLQVMMFERRSRTAGANAKVIDAPYINQKAVGLPNGCESVSAVMALQYAGLTIDTETFANTYLPRGSAPSNGIGPDPAKVYVGDPHLTGGLGWGCYAPVIIKAAGDAADRTKYQIIDASGSSLQSLCSTYIDNGTPVIVWATVRMTSDVTYTNWKTSDGDSIKYNNRLHSLLLVGYDSDYYYFNDPLTRVGDNKYFAYKKSKVESAYTLLGKQAIAIKKIYCTEITLSSLPEKVLYLLGEEFDPEGMALLAKYSDGTQKIITDCEFSGAETSIPGEQTVTYSYTDPLGGSVSGTYGITVYDTVPRLLEIEIGRLPAKLTYEIGEELDTTDLVIFAEYEKYGRDEDGDIVLETYYEEATEYEVSGFESESEGEKTVTVTLGECSTTFAVTVEENDVLIGDANGDGDVNMKDVLLCRRFIAGLASDSSLNFACADTDGDGDITMRDVFYIRRYIAGIIQ